MSSKMIELFSEHAAGEPAGAIRLTRGAGISVEHSEIPIMLRGLRIGDALGASDCAALGPRCPLDTAHRQIVSASRRFHALRYSAAAIGDQDLFSL